MAQEENFGYSLSLPELTNDHIAQSLRKKISSFKKSAALSFLEGLVLPYVAENYSGKFPEPWDSAVYSGIILLEIFAVGACLYSAHTWRQASKQLNELEEKVKTEDHSR